MATRPLAKLYHATQPIAGPSRYSIKAVQALPSPSVNPKCADRTSRRTICTSAIVGSGHNKWSKIRHKKGAEDAKRSAMISKYVGDINLALRGGQSHDPTVNSRLATAVDKAREAGVTKANIEATFERARKVADGTGKEMVYEAVGPGGREAMIIECLSDNSNRMMQRIKEAMSKHGCRLAPVAFLFAKKGLVSVTPTSDKTFDDLFELAIEGGAEDVRQVEGDIGAVWEIATPPNQLHTMTTHLTSSPHDTNYTLQSSELAYVPVDPLNPAEEGVTEKNIEGFLKTVDFLEAEPDVVRVWTNLADD